MTSVKVIKHQTDWNPSSHFEATARLGHPYSLMAKTIAMSGFLPLGRLSRCLIPAGTQPRNPIIDGVLANLYAGMSDMLVLAIPQ